LDRWYLRSFKDGEAHYGRINEDAMVTARCGLTFVPQPRLFGKGPAFARPPVDPLQACPKCRTTATHADTDGAEVQGLIEILSSPSRSGCVRASHDDTERHTALDSTA
jgi:hypothetical protein